MVFSPIKQAALEYDLPVLQPEKVNQPEVMEQLEALGADLYVVVAFPGRKSLIACWLHPATGVLTCTARSCLNTGERHLSMPLFSMVIRSPVLPPCTWVRAGMMETLSFRQKSPLRPRHRRALHDRLMVKS